MTVRTCTICGDTIHLQAHNDSPWCMSCEATKSMAAHETGVRYGTEIRDWCLRFIAEAEEAGLANRSARALVMRSLLSAAHYVAQHRKDEDNDRHSETQEH